MLSCAMIGNMNSTEHNSSNQRHPDALLTSRYDKQPITQFHRQYHSYEILPSKNSNQDGRSNTKTNYKITIFASQRNTTRHHCARPPRIR